MRLERYSVHPSTYCESKTAPASPSAEMMVTDLFPYTPFNPHGCQSGDASSWTRLDHGVTKITSAFQASRCLMTR
ncbi:unnamed protein product [Diplocarpon coronariae]